MKLLCPGTSPYPETKTPLRAFTLIELLIVVAIISILAAIAVPNLLEAQTRSKVSRAHADMRSVSTALEAYRVDENTYPLAEINHLFIDRLVPVTTPIAYITSIPFDPFFVFSTEAYGGDEPEYCYASGNIYAGGSTFFDTVELKGSIYSLAARGPDRNITWGGYCMAHPNAFRGGGNVRGAYDPTNGTISEGDIFRLSAGTAGR